jgi:AraC-like DNA-binding protein
MDQLFNLIESTKVIANPFQLQMRHDKHSLDIQAFDAPLPLSSARQNPALLKSFSGVFHAAWPCLQVVALEGAAATTQLDKRSWLSLVYVVAGELSFHQKNLVLRCSPGDCLFVPQGAGMWESTTYSIVCLSIPPEQVLVSLKSLKPDESGKDSIRKWDFSKLSCMRADDGKIEASILKTLYHVLTITSELAINAPHLQTHLGVTNQLSLLTALMACPDLSDALASERKEATDGGIDQAVNELINYMMTQLSQPLNLSILEKHSHYSRRSLQYAFRQRFGCTITQWIRAQRLDLALKRLKMATREETVSSIAHACGYRSSSLFSIEFQNRFHIKPSVLLREHQS